MMSTNEVSLNYMVTKIEITRTSLLENVFLFILCIRGASTNSRWSRMERVVDARRAEEIEPKESKQSVTNRYYFC